MGNKFVWKNLLINGIIGAVVAVLFCILAGLGDGLGYAFVVGFIGGDFVGIVIYVIKVIKEVKEKQAQGLLPKPKSKEELALEKKKQEELQMVRYTKLVQSLSKKDIEKLEDVLQTVESFSQIHNVPLPKQAQLLSENISKYKSKAHEGTLTKEQVIKFAQLIGNFHLAYNNLQTFSITSGQQALNTDLGFGVIGDVIDVAVYSIMKNVEQKKALNKSQQAVYSKLCALMQAFCNEAFTIANI